MAMVVVKPDDLKKDKQFQEKFPLVQGKLQQLLLFLQRDTAKKFANNPEEAGRRVLILTEIMEVFDEIGIAAFEAPTIQHHRRLNRGKLNNDRTKPTNDEAGPKW